MTDAFDRRRYPRAAAMLESMPHGMRSHLGCRVKGAVVRSWMTQQRVAFDRGSVPDEVIELCENPPLPSDWVQTAIARTTWLATADSLFPGDDAAALAWTNRGVKRVVDSGLYRALIALASPRLLVKALEVNLRAVDKGTTMSSQVDGKSGRIVWRYPVGIVPRLTAEATAYALELLLKVSSARHPRIEVAAHSDISCRFEATWD